MPPKAASRKPSAATATKPAAAAGGKRKKLTFDESTIKAAAEAVQTTTINATAPAKRAAPARRTTSHAASKAKPSAADHASSGIVKAKAAVTKQAAAAAEAAAAALQSSGHAMEEESSDDEAELVNGTAPSKGEESLSDVADRPSSEDEEEEAAKGKTVSRKSRKGKVSYKAVRLSFMPAEFQEPELNKFLNQFGAKVLNCFCVRSKRTHRSRGVAYVEFDKPSIIPLVVEECNGMALGGMSVRAREVEMHHKMPSKSMVKRRRELAYTIRTRGAPLKRYDVSTKRPIALLIKAARTERENNAHLKKLGVEYQTDFFLSQLAALPAELKRKPAPVPEDKKQDKKKKRQGKKGMSNGKAAAFKKTSSRPAAAAAVAKKKRAKKDSKPAAGKAAPSAAAVKKSVTKNLKKFAKKK